MPILPQTRVTYMYSIQVENTGWRLGGKEFAPTIYPGLSC